MNCTDPPPEHSRWRDRRDGNEPWQSQRACAALPTSLAPSSTVPIGVEPQEARHALLEESDSLPLTGARELVEAPWRPSLAGSLLPVLPAAFDPTVVFEAVEALEDGPGPEVGMTGEG
jgi:hypothetical protein